MLFSWSERLGGSQQSSENYSKHTAALGLKVGHSFFKKFLKNHLGFSISLWFPHLKTTTSFPSYLPTVFRYISEETSIKYKSTNPKPCFLYDQWLHNVSYICEASQSSEFKKGVVLWDMGRYISSFCLLNPYSLKYLIYHTWRKKDNLEWVHLCCI